MKKEKVRRKILVTVLSLLILPFHYGSALGNLSLPEIEAGLKVSDIVSKLDDSVLLTVKGLNFDFTETEYGIGGDHQFNLTTEKINESLEIEEIKIPRLIDLDADHVMVSITLRHNGSLFKFYENSIHIDEDLSINREEIIDWLNQNTDGEMPAVLNMSFKPIHSHGLTIGTTANQKMLFDGDLEIQYKVKDKNTTNNTGDNTWNVTHYYRYHDVSGKDSEGYNKYNIGSERSEISYQINNHLLSSEINVKEVPSKDLMVGDVFNISYDLHNKSQLNENHNIGFGFQLNSEDAVTLLESEDESIRWEKQGKLYFGILNPDIYSDIIFPNGKIELNSIFEVIDFKQSNIIIKPFTYHMEDINKRIYSDSIILNELSTQSDSTVVIKYLDSNGNPILEDRIISKPVGETYTVIIENIEGYEFIKSDGELNGIITENELIITLTYRVKETLPVDKESSIKVLYVDTKTNKVIKTLVYHGIPGDPFSLPVRNISSYKPITTNYDTIFGTQNKEIIVYLEPLMNSSEDDSDTSKPNEILPSTGVSSFPLYLIAIVFCLLGFVLVVNDRRQK